VRTGRPAVLACDERGKAESWCANLRSHTASTQC
jgi:hypothetical protein